MSIRRLPLCNTLLISSGGRRGELAELVKSRAVTAVEVVDAHLAQIARYDSRVGAFQLVRADEARTEAEALDTRDELGDLPLAGVPIAIKDVLDVAGEPTRVGSLATSGARATVDNELVRRLRTAGAIVVGKTRVPELCAWPWTDGVFGITRNPWNLDRTPGGSSGGSAAAVAAAMTPVAHGSDGGGSIRIPAAACGLVGIKPGAGVIPAAPGRSGWNGLASDGPLATTVDDLTLALAVLADRPDLRDVTVPSRPLRVAVSVRSPLSANDIDPAFAAAARSTGELLASAGHTVGTADPPYEPKTLFAMGTRSLAGMAEDASDMNRSLLERRSRPIVAVGAAVQRFGLVRDADRDRWRARAASSSRISTCSSPRHSRRRPSSPRAGPGDRGSQTRAPPRSPRSPACGTSPGTRRQRYRPASTPTECRYRCKSSRPTAETRSSSRSQSSSKA